MDVSWIINYDFKTAKELRKEAAEVRFIKAAKYLADEDVFDPSSLNIVINWAVKEGKLNATFPLNGVRSKDPFFIEDKYIVSGFRNDDKLASELQEALDHYFAKWGFTCEISVCRKLVTIDWSGASFPEIELC